MDGRGRRSYKMFQIQFLTPPASSQPHCYLHLPFLFFYFSQSPDISLFPPLSTLLGQWKRPIFPFLLPSLYFRLFLAPCEHFPSHWEGPSAYRWRTVTVQFWVHGASKMSQLIRSLTPLRDSSFLITAKELITGLSMDFCFSLSASEESWSFKYRK